MVTIIVSMKPDLSPVLAKMLFDILLLEKQSLLRYGECVLLVVETKDARMPRNASHAMRARALQKHRQHVVETLIPGHAKRENDYVIFHDADITRLPQGTFLELVDTCKQSTPFSIVAPAIVLESSAGNPYSDRFYDTAGFVHDNTTAQLARPWFPASAYKQSSVPVPSVYEEWRFPKGTTVELNGSVGCVYCVHAPLLNRGGFLGEFDPRFTEHWPLCRTARKLGGRLLVRMDIIAQHAYLPNYGENFH